jgi:hypothetical protein
VVQVSGGPPVVVVADQFHDMVGYSFFPGRRFIEVFRAQEPARFMRSSPISLFGQSAVGTTKIDRDRQQDVDGAIVFAGPSASKLPAVPTGRGPILATPTRLADVRFVALESRPDGSAILVMKRSAVPPPPRAGTVANIPARTIARGPCSLAHARVRFDGGRLPLLRRWYAVRGEPLQLGRGWVVAARDRTSRPCLCYCFQHPLHFLAARLRSVDSLSPAIWKVRGSSSLDF